MKRETNDLHFLTSIKDIAKMKSDIEYLRTTTNKIEKSNEQLNCKLDKFIECADNKYAHKATEKEVKELKDTIHKIKYTLAKYAGGILVIMTAIQLAIMYYK